MKRFMRIITAVILSIVFTLACSVTAFAVSSLDWEYPEENEGIYNDVFLYERNSDNTITLKRYRGDDIYVTVPDYIEGMPVTAIGDNCFDSKKSIKRVFLPETITKIGKTAFFGCSSLEAIEFPSSLRSIGYAAFQNCSSLEYVEFNEGLEIIGEQAFLRCSSITELEFPKSLEEIGDHAFWRCYNLESIKFNDKSDAVEIGDGAFNRCENLYSVEMKHKPNILFSGAFEFSGILYKRAIYMIIAGIVLSIILLIVVMIVSSVKKKKRTKALVPPTTRKCESCGMEIAAQAKFCPGCGVALEPLPPPEPTAEDKKKAKKSKAISIAVSVFLIILIIGGIVAIGVLFAKFDLEADYIFGDAPSHSYSKAKDKFQSSEVSLDEANANAQEVYYAVEEFFYSMWYNGDRPQDHLQHGTYAGLYDLSEDNYITQDTYSNVNNGYVQVIYIRSYDDYYNDLTFYVQWCADENGHGTIGQYPEPISEYNNGKAIFGTYRTAYEMEGYN